MTQSPITPNAAIANPLAAELRTAEPGDRAAVQAFLLRLSPSTVWDRYLAASSSLAGPTLEREVQRLLDRDAHRHVVFLAMNGADVRGVGEFIADESGHTAELGLVVEDAFQQRGIGRLLYRRLEDVARDRDIRAFVGDVHWQNRRVQAMLRGIGRPLTVQPGYASARFTLELDPSDAEAR